MLENLNLLLNLANKAKRYMNLNEKIDININKKYKLKSKEQDIKERIEAKINIIEKNNKRIKEIKDELIENGLPQCVLYF